MAPSPAAGTQTAPPKTPTKLTQKPQGTPSKFGSGSAKGTPSTPKTGDQQKPGTDVPSQNTNSGTPSQKLKTSTPLTAKAGEAQKPGTSTPSEKANTGTPSRKPNANTSPTRKAEEAQKPNTNSLSQTPNAGTSPQKSSTNAPSQKPNVGTSSNKPAKPATTQVPTKAQQATNDAEQRAENGVPEAQSEAGAIYDDDEEPMSKVTEATQEPKQVLEEVAPEPINDDEDDSPINGNRQQAQDTSKDDKDDSDDNTDNVTEKADQGDESAGDTGNDQQQQQDQQQGQGLLKGAQGLAGKASSLAGKPKQDPKSATKHAADDVNEHAEDTIAGAQESSEDDAGEDEAERVADEATDEPESSTEDVQDEAANVVDEGQDQAGDVQDEAEGVAEDAQNQPQGATEGAKEAAEDATEDAQGQAEDTLYETKNTTGGEADDNDNVNTELPKRPEGLPLDLSVLKDREVQGDGTVVDDEGNLIGRLAEGDAEDLEGYPIGDDGEILDEDGDLVGRVELMPEEVKRQLEVARQQGTELPEGAEEYIDSLGQTAGEGDDATADDKQLPGLEIMNGFTCGIDGLVYDGEGNTIGRVTDGDVEQLQDAVLNDQGDFVDNEGNVVGHAEIHEDASILVEEGLYAPAGATEEQVDEAGEQVGEEGAEAEAATGEAVADAQEKAEDAQEQAEDAKEHVAEIEDQLPGIEALQGRELNEAGEVQDSAGNILAQIQDEDLKQKIADGEIDPATLNINEEGEVVDQEGNVLETLDLEEGAVEKLVGGPMLDLRILEGRKVNKKGKILDEDGEEIGELRDGELSDCAGKKVDDKGNVLDKKGKVVGHVNVSRGEAAENATRSLMEELGELEEQGPDLSILEGYKVNKKGLILDEEGETIGQLAEGDLQQCAGKKVDGQGQVLDKDGNVIGRVQLPAEEEEAESTAKEPEEEQPGGEQPEEAEEGQDLPSLSILEGLTVNKSGKLIDATGAIVGELTEGDAKKLSKNGTTCDDQGQFWDNKGHIVGRAQTLPQQDAEEEAIFAGLDGLHVVEGGYVVDENDNKVGIVTEGDSKKLIGRIVDEDGDILDKKGSAVGHAERWEEPEEEEQTPEEIDYSNLAGKTVNKAGLVIGDNGVPIARLIEGKASDLAGRELDDKGQVWNNKGQVIGRVELIPEDEREQKPEGPFAGLEGLRVVKDGKVADENDNIVGEIVEGNARRLIGLAVDEDGDIVDKYGNVKGHAEPLEEQEEEVIDYSILKDKALNKQGYVVDENGTPFGRLVEGDAKELAGRRCDDGGYLYNDTGKAVGRCEPIPENQRVGRPEGPFAGYEGLRIVDEGWVEDGNGNRCGQLVDGNVKRLVGMAVDEDGDIVDKYGNVKGRAEPYEAPDEEAIDLSALAGCRINKSGNAVDFSGQIIGRVSQGDLKTLSGKKVDGKGQVWDDAGNVIGQCELVQGEDTSPEGPFAGFEGLQINKDGTIITSAGDVIGRITEGDVQKLLGHRPDEDGEITDKNGNVIGRAERWEPEEKTRNVNPMSGMHVNKEGEVRDENGDLVGRLTEGGLGHCVGQEIDDAGNVVDVDGNKIGEVTLLANIAEDFDGPTEEELEEARIRDEERQIAEKMSGICTQTIEKMQPICKQITDHMDKADRTPKEELDEEELVNNVKPLIEEGGRILQECNGSLRGLDPDGKIAAQAKGRSGTGEATPEEHRLAENLKELTSTVVTTIDNAKKKLNDMPHAKKKLNPLWGLMTQPLFQILAAVGLLLAGVLGLVGQLLNALGLGGLVNGLLGGLGINKLMGAIGLGGGDKKKGDKEGGGVASKLSSLPVVGGLLGGK